MADGQPYPRKGIPKSGEKHVYLGDRMNRFWWVAAFPSDLLELILWPLFVFGSTVRSLFKKLWKR